MTSPSVKESSEGQKTKPVSSRHAKVTTADVVKLAGLIVFFVAMGVVVAYLWPYLSGIFEEGGIDRLINEVRAAGPMGVLMMELLQFLQIIVAFIPGEAVQIAAGMVYGPWWGAVVILVGCVVSSAFIYLLVHKLGAPFVQHMVPDKWLVKFQEFEESGRLHTVVFILFLIPAMPKDVFTYLVPLTNMSMRDFIALANIGRIPGVLLSTFAASQLASGDWVSSAVLFGIAAALAIAGVVFRDRLLNILGKKQAQ